MKSWLLAFGHWHPQRKSAPRARPPISGGKNICASIRMAIWRPAVIAGFVDAGYKIEKDYGSFRSRQELLRALDDGDRRIGYNAYRLLNDIYHTHFDLDIAFIHARYERGEDFPDRSPGLDANEARLKKYWQKRLGR